MGQQILKEIKINDLLTEVLKVKNEGYRLVAITCSSKEGLELTYSFDKDYELLNFRFEVDTETEVSSISALYPYAFLYENEIKELFGANIKNISIDFNNTLYKIPVKTPFHMKSSELEVKHGK